MPQAIERLFATPMIRPRLPVRMPGRAASATPGTSLGSPDKTGGVIVSAMNHPNLARSRERPGILSRGAPETEGQRRRNGAKPSSPASAAEGGERLAPPPAGDDRAADYPLRIRATRASMSSLRSLYHFQSTWISVATLASVL